MTSTCPHCNRPIHSSVHTHCPHCYRRIHDINDELRKHFTGHYDKEESMEIVPVLPGDKELAENLWIVDDIHEE